MLGFNMVDIDKRLIHAFVLLGRQYLVTEHIVKHRKPRVLSLFEKEVDSKKTSINDVIRVYELAFSIVDNIVRYQKIASILPRFSQKSEEFKTFESKLHGLKELRNLLQHINGDIDTEFESPILGGVTWVKKGLNYMAAFNHLGEERSLPGIVYDTQEMKFTREFCYVHNGTYYDLSVAIEGYRNYQKFVESKCKVDIDGKQYRIKDHFIALAMEFKLVTAQTQQGTPADQ